MVCETLKIDIVFNKIYKHFGQILKNGIFDIMTSYPSVNSDDYLFFHNNCGSVVIWSVEKEKFYRDGRIN